LLIDEVSKAAYEAIEQAAAEAARAAMLASIEREALLLREKAEAMSEVKRWKNEMETVKQTRIRTTFIAGLICFVCGFTTGVILTGGK